MTLTKYKIGALVSVVDERNNLGIRKFYGININKEFMPTVANTNGLDETKYKLVRKNRFVYSGMQTGRDQCIRISMYTHDNIILVSPAYITFEVTATSVVIPLYFFMLFMSKEKDRYGAFCSDGSIRANLDWDAFCDIEINLPPIKIQQKYVAIYQAMLANQQSYEKGLEDLKIVFDGILDKEKFVSDKQPVKKLLEEVDERNEDGLLKDVLGINVNKEFMPSVANVKNIDLSRYKIVKSEQLAFSGMQTGRDQCIRIALNKSKNPILISPAYTVFKIKTKAVIAEYIMMWFSRAESDRKGWFMSDSSIRSNLDLERFYETQIPVPDLKRQHGVANIYSVYKERQHINEKLKEQIKKICPILIKGSLEEAGI